ncbi:MAG: Fe-S cluster domain-containing protein [Bacteroidaceae bacterium]|nr:Fe-S cluster domain-containing protein [Bacteroidaceae bacterium]
MNVILIAVIVLGAIGLIAALVLFFVSKKFAVKEDPRIGQVSEVLPQANCGGCGFPGCGGFASACVKAADAGSLEGLLCPVGGQPVMEKVASILGMQVGASAPKVAVVRCNGTCENRPRVAVYDGVKSCRVANTTCSGETNCAYGCLGCGDCVAACQFDAIKMNPVTGLPEVDATKCTACGACAKACPRNIIEIRIVSGDKKEAFYVECMNKDKGAVATKACAAACIACMKCEKVCGFDAVHVENNLAYIDPNKCQLCGECEKACPKQVITFMDINGKKPKPKLAAAPAAKTAATAKAATKAAAPKAPSTPREPIIVKYDAPLLPSQQIVLAGTIDLDAPEKQESAGKIAEIEHKYDAPLLPSQQILLGGK